MERQQQYHSPIYSPQASAYGYNPLITGHRRRKKNKKILPFFLLIFIISMGVFFMGKSALQHKQAQSFSILSPLAGPIEQSVKAINTMVESTGLEEVVSTSLAGAKGEYSVVIKNLKTNEQFAIEENKQYDSASLYKLWTMGKVYELIDEEKLKETDIVQGSVADLNRRFNIASEEAELSEGSFKYTIKQALEQMITISHNYAALLLTSRIGVSNVNEFVKAQGLENSHTGSPPRTTAADTAYYLEKIYKGEVVNTAASAEMLELLSRQKLNDRIPKYLPKGTKVAHKTGELWGNKHDAGIVFTEKGDYIIVMLSNSNSPVGAAEREAELSKAVFEYFQNK